MTLVGLERGGEIGGELRRVLGRDLVIEREVPVIDVHRKLLDRPHRESQVVVAGRLRLEIGIAVDDRDESREVVVCRRERIVDAVREERALADTAGTASARGTTCSTCRAGPTCPFGVL